MTRLQDLKDQSLEAEIVMAGKNVEIAQLSMQEPWADYFYFSGQRDYWARVMRDCILARSPEQIKRMKAARGLAA